MLATNPDIEAILKVGSLAGRWRASWLVLIAAILLAFAAGLWWFAARETESAIQYRTAPVSRGPLTVTVSATGTLEPLTQVQVGSALSGKVTAVKVDYNDTVVAGQVLAEIDTDRLVAQANRTRALLEVANAGVIEKQAALTQAEKDFARVKPLATRNLASMQTLETAEATRDRADAALLAAKAQVRVAQADLSTNETELGNAVIRSPINGIVLDRNVDPGQTVAASFQAPVLFTIADDLSRMHLLIDVDEADAGSVKQGQQASFTVEALPDEHFDAKVLQLRYAPVTVNGVVTYKSVLSVDNAGLKLRPGMTAAAEIVVQQIDNALRIPNAALRYAPPAQAAPPDNRNWLSRLLPGRQRSSGPAPAEKLPEGKKRLWVLRGGIPTPVLITPGASDGSWTQVIQGDIAAGDQLVVDTAGGP